MISFTGLVLCLRVKRHGTVTWAVRGSPAARLESLGRHMVDTTTRLKATVTAVYMHGRGAYLPPTLVVMRGRARHASAALEQPMLYLQSRILTLARGIPPMNMEWGDVMQGAKECPRRRVQEWMKSCLPPCHNLMNDVSIPWEKSHMHILCSEAKSVSQCGQPGDLEHDITWSSPHETIYTVSGSTVMPDCARSQGHDHHRQQACVPWCNRSRRRRFFPCGHQRDRR